MEFHRVLFLDPYRIYMLPIGHIEKKPYNFYADDTTLYFSFHTSHTSQSNNLHMSLISITGLNWIFSSNITKSCRNLGIIFDNHLSFDIHTLFLLPSHFFFNLEGLQNFYLPKSYKQISHINYCNALFSFLTQQNIS